MKSNGELTRNEMYADKAVVSRLLGLRNHSSTPYKTYALTLKMRRLSACASQMRINLGVSDGIRHKTNDNHNILNNHGSGKEYGQKIVLTDEDERCLPGWFVWEGW